MSDVASLELCQELYKLSGWDRTAFVYHNISGTLLRGGGFRKSYTPAYDLGYLLRKLPPRQDPDFGDEVMYYPGVHMIGEVIHKIHAIAGYWDIEGNMWGDWSEVGDTPENAACKLAIELFHQGILTKEGV